MRILLFKHFAFDEAAVITDWAASRKHEVMPWFPPDSTAFPDLSQFDCLIIFGGPMSVYQESEHPWLIEEKRFIRSAVEAGKRVLGICRAEASRSADSAAFLSDVLERLEQIEI